MISQELKKIENIWPKISHFFHIPRNEKEYNKLVKLLDEITDEVGNNENHQLASLMEMLGILISEYEDRNIVIKSKSGLEILSYLMTENNLKQTDLKELGSQGVVSEILNGKRELNLNQIRKLSKKFNVSASVFI